MPDLNPDQRRALNRLESAADDVLRIAIDMRAEMDGFIEAVKGGYVTRSLNHQRPFDLQRALTLRTERSEACLPLDIDHGLIIESSKGTKR